MKYSHADVCCVVSAGFCAISSTLPAPRNTKTELSTAAVIANGLNPSFQQTFHCIAAEPDATFLRISVTDGGQEVAYESVVLGRLRPGYRIFQMRGSLGTRIELCYLLVRISFGSEPNKWFTPRHQELKLLEQRKVIQDLAAQLNWKTESSFLSPSEPEPGAVSGLASPSLGHSNGEDINDDDEFV